MVTARVRNCLRPTTACVSPLPSHAWRRASTSKSWVENMWLLPQIASGASSTSHPVAPLGDEASDEEALALLPADVAEAIRNALPAQPVPVADAIRARHILGKCGAAAAAAAMPELSRDVIYRGVLQCFRLVGRFGEPMCCLKSAAAMSRHKQAVRVWISTALRTWTTHGIFVWTAPFIVVLHLPLAGVHGRGDGGRAAAAGACMLVARSRRQSRSCRGASGGYFRPASRYVSSCSLLFPGSAAQYVIGKGCT